MPLKAVSKLEDISRNLTAENLTDIGYKTFYDETPVRSGNARRNTKKQAREIQANYPYAKRLDEGYSKQSPDGMVQPTLAAIRRYVAGQLGKIYGTNYR